MEYSGPAKLDKLLTYSVGTGSGRSYNACIMALMLMVLPLPGGP